MCFTHLCYERIYVYSIQHAVFLDFICILHVESLNQINQNKPHLTEQSDTLKRISQSA